MRMIQVAIAALLRIAGLRKAGEYQDALALIDLTFEQLLGLRSNMLRGLDDDRVYYLLTRGETLDLPRLAVTADLLAEEGDVYSAQAETLQDPPAKNEAQSTALNDYARALRFNLEIYFQTRDAGEGEEQETTRQKIGSLLERLNRRPLGSDTLWPLALYYEDTGDLPRAESALQQMAAMPAIRDQILPELEAFHQRHK